MKFFYQKLRVLATLIILTGLWSTSVKAQLINEGFTTMVPLPTGWAQQNLSTPIGTSPNWFQGNTAVFNAFSGPTNSYAGVNFNSVAGANTINNWLFTPTVAIANGNIFSFYTRVGTGGGQFPDRLQLRMSTNGASVDVGNTNTSVGDFTTLLIDVNPTLTTTGYPEVWTQFTATISGVAVPTTGRFAFRYFVTDGGPAGANSNYLGVDQVLYGATCTGTPAPGNTISSVASVCPAIPFTLSLQNPSAGPGITYQWQSSPDNTVWTDIATATNATLTTTQNVATWYRCNVSCTPNTGASTSLQVSMNPPLSCYCIPGNTDCTLDDEILNVNFAGINNSSSGCTGTGYTNYSATVAPATVIAGGTFPISVRVGPGGNEFVGVWIDANQNGVFEASEFTLVGAANSGGAGVTITGNVTIPANATITTTRMRVRVRFGTALTGANACIGYGFGESEDYSITITPCVPLNITTQPANATIQCGGDATFTVASTGSGPSYKWQEKTSATALWTDITNGGVYSGATTATLTLTGAPSSMNGYQYRVVFTGFCRSTDYTNAGTLTVSPLVANVNPASAVICNGAVQQLTITNITSPQPGTVNVASGPISVLVPDSPVNPPNAATLLGANNAITMAGIPAAAVITGISVKFNMTHTWCGDMVMVLKAPNGQILNLDYFLNSTGGVGATTGFVNTVISSTGTAALSSVTNLYTGIFRADRSTATGATPAGPTNFAPTTNLWTGLYTNGASANGTWTLAMYDGGAGDVGTLTSWDITIDYLAGIPATGVWNPTTPANTIFTDAAATIPYVAGTPANSVYVLPTTTTDYTVVVTTPVCVSGVTTVPVTVSNPILTVTAPVNASTCANGNASFTTGAASGNVIAYQWQVSTDGGGSWTDIANGGVYAGATTATLTLTNVPATFNNNQYHAVLTVAACTSTATSAAATLTVNAVPVVVINAGPYTQLYPGITTTLTAAINTNPTNATYQWFRNGVAVTGATSATLVVDVDNLGVYTVSVVDGNGCSGSSTASITISAAANATLFIYPSPNNGQFQVRYQSLDGNSVVRKLNIYDSKGSRVYTQAYSIIAPYGMMSVDMKNQGKGIYRVELSDGNGNRIATGSVLVL